MEDKMISFHNLAPQKTLAYDELNPRRGDLFIHVTAEGRKLMLQTTGNDCIGNDCIEVSTGVVCWIADAAQVEKVIRAEIKVFYES